MSSCCLHDPQNIVHLDKRKTPATLASYRNMCFCNASGAGNPQLGQNACNSCRAEREPQRQCWQRKLFCLTQHHTMHGQLAANLHAINASFGTKTVKREKQNSPMCQGIKFPTRRHTCVIPTRAIAKCSRRERQPSTATREGRGPGSSQHCD